MWERLLAQITPLFHFLICQNSYRKKQSFLNDKEDAIFMTMLWNTCLKRAGIFEYVNKIPQLDMFFSVPHSWLHQEMVNSNRSNQMNTSM